jgi:repressor LexA
MHETKRKILALARSRNLGDMSLKQIGDAVGIKNPSGVSYHLSQLYASGHLKRAESGVVTAFDSQSDALSLNSIPILGAANCGPASLYAEDVIEGFLQVSAKLVQGKKLFALRASGNSMNNAQAGDSKDSIEDGDYVVIDSTKRNPESGSYIVAVLEGLANIKRLSKNDETGQVALLSESTEPNPPIFLHFEDFDKFFIAGEVKFVLKKPAVGRN